MVRGEAGRFGARTQSQLAVNRAQVPIDGARTEEEPFRHLNVGQSDGNQPQDFDLTGAQSGRVDFW